MINGYLEQMGQMLLFQASAGDLRLVLDRLDTSLQNGVDVDVLDILQCRHRYAGGPGQVQVELILVRRVVIEKAVACLHCSLAGVNRLALRSELEAGIRQPVRSTATRA